MKKLLAIILAALMIAACSVTAFAADTTTVTYEVQPTYTVSIPASVTLSDADVTADITASDVVIENGSQITVKLTAASNTASGSTFNAKNGDSTVNYTITADSSIAVGDTVEKDQVRQRNGHPDQDRGDQHPFRDGNFTTKHSKKTFHFTISIKTKIVIMYHLNVINASRRYGLLSIEKCT